MKPFLLLVISGILASTACHKKNTTPSAALNSYWKLVEFDFYGPGPVQQPLPDTAIYLYLFEGNKYTTSYSQQISQGTYTIERAPHIDLFPTASYPDSILTFADQPWLTPDGSLRLLQKAAITIRHGDSLIFETYGLPPTGVAKFIFKKGPPIPMD